MTPIVIAFFAVTLLLFALPFVPGLREARARHDADALPVPPGAAVDVRHFANGFRVFLERELGDDLASVRTTGMRRTGWIEEQGSWCVLPAREPLELFDDEAQRRELDRIVVGAGDLEIPAGLRCRREVYAGGSLDAGAATELRAALAEEDMRMGDSGRVVRWVHAGRHLEVGADVVLQGRASAGRAIALAAGCRFERMHAPVIRFGAVGTQALPRAGAVHGAPAVDVAAWRPHGLPAHHEFAAGRLLVEGDLEIPAGARVTCDLVVWGRLTFGAGARLEGSAKSHGDMRLGAGVHVDGSVIGQRDVTIEDGAAVDGPVIAEGRLTIGTRCVVGAADEPSTVRAGSIAVRVGSVIHGTAWASGHGEVLA